MRPVLLSISVLLLATAAGSVTAGAQSPDPSIPVAPEAAATADLAEAGSPAAGAAAQEGAVLPRSLTPYWHVFAAFAIAWLLLLGYALWVGRRVARLDEEVKRLRRMPE